MKKLLIAAAALAAILPASCKKDDNNSAVNNWHVGGTAYTAVTAKGAGSNGAYLLAGSGEGIINPGDAILFKFNGDVQPAAGNYRLVSYDSAVKAGEVSFFEQNITATDFTTYVSTGSGTVNAAVTVTGGKVSLIMPDAACEEKYRPGHRFRIGQPAADELKPQPAPFSPDARHSSKSFFGIGND